MSGKRTRALLVPLRTRDGLRVAKSHAENPDENQWVTTHCYPVCSKQSSKVGGEEDSALFGAGFQRFDARVGNFL